MFLLFDVTNQGLILGYFPESLGVLIFGVALVLLTVALRALLKRGAKGPDREMEHQAK